MSTLKKTKNELKRLNRYNNPKDTKLDVRKLKERILLSKSTASELKIPCPEGLEPRPYQRAGVHYHITNLHKRTLIADPPGLGKTIMYILISNFLGLRKNLLIVPASLTINWEKEFLKWTILGINVFRVKKGKDVIPEDADVIIMSYGMAINANIRKQLFKRRFDMIGIDEVHLLKNTKAQRTQQIYGFNRKKGLITLGDYLIGMSGTPFVNRPIEIFSTIKSFCHKTISNKSWYSFAKRYCGAFDGDYGIEFGKPENTKELGLLLRGHFMIRRKKTDVLKDLPPLQTRIVYLEKNPEANRVIKRMGRFHADDIEGDGASASFEGISADRKALGLAKIKAAVDFIKNQLEGGQEKIVVFAHHREVIEQLQEGLSEYGAVKLYGGMTADKKNAAVEAFQDDPNCRIFVGSIIAAGVGLTLTAASYGCAVEWSYVPGENKQAVDRLHRIGQLFSVLFDFLAFENTLDENVIIAHIEKWTNIKEILFD